MDDFQLWMHDAEAVLASEDQGRDMSEVKFLLKKHQLAEADIEVHVTEVERVACQAQEFVDDEHFNSPSIQQSAADVLKRYRASLSCIIIPPYCLQGRIIVRALPFIAATSSNRVNELVVGRDKTNHLGV